MSENNDEKSRNYKLNVLKFREIQQCLFAIQLGSGFVTYTILQQSLTN